MKHRFEYDEEAASALLPSPQPNLRSTMLTSNSKSCLNVEFYKEICQIRLELGEDREQAKLLTEVFLAGRQLKRKEYMDLVASLYYSYPLLKENYLTVFEALRQVAVDHYNRDPAYFLDCVHSLWRSRGD